ncbi:hypothetical protein CDL12_26004 [Handroanthus impetiginosus]|uniref:GTD-binding domain-containing protein n=1 Tax=Handroanthus impetiginosus TaxID=429701 RepID=A0A2G9G868_9LAMI|nr:hypothetical protein CDL12_26004 [Handroanthus impetiginosus]
MQLFVRLCPFVILCSVFGFHKGFVKFLFGGFLFANCVSCLKHLTQDYELGCGFLMFGSFKWVYEFLVLLLLFCFGLKFLYPDGFSRGLVRFLCDLRGKSGELKNWFCLKNSVGPLKLLKEDSYAPLIDKTEEKKEKPNPDTDSDEEYYDGKEYSEEDDESDVSKLRKLIKIELQKANAAYAELMKERAASASAAEEAMTMILRLQNEKSLVEMELSQYRRLAEEKQIHDQEVIKSLQWLVCRHESERSLLEYQLKVCRNKLKRFLRDEAEEDGEVQSPFSGNISDALENVFYSSREANLLPQ